MEFKLAESDAADVAQTTWLRLLEHIDRIEYPDRVGSWLAATARNECLRSLAARKRVVLGHDEVELTSVVAYEPEVDERLLADERAQVVREAVSACPAAGSGCSRCSWPIRRRPTPRYPISSTCPSAASGPPVDDAWPSCAFCCRPPSRRVGRNASGN